MKIRFQYWVITSLIIAAGCQNIEDAQPSDRTTFVQFHEAAHNITAVSAEATPNGFVILANEVLLNNTINTVLIFTNEDGLQTGERLIIPNTRATNLLVTADGYFTLGQQIKSNVGSDDVSTFDQLVYSVTLNKISTAGVIVDGITIADTAKTNITDIFSGSLTVNSQNELIVLGTFKKAAGGATTKPFLAGLNITTLDTLWSRKYEVLDRDYVNTKTIQFVDDSHLIWASALKEETPNFERTYIGVPYMEENSTFENFSTFGEQTDQRLLVKEIQPIMPSALGFAIIGTNATPVGDNSNMFFVRVDKRGNIIEGSERYFDAASGQTSSATSSTQDIGETLTATHDNNLVFGGTFESTPAVGNGGSDILLIKTDIQGNIIWKKIIGGTGNETISSIRELESGDLLICGTNNLSGLTSVFLIRTDSNGELKK